MSDDFQEFVRQFKALTDIDLSCYNKPQALRRLTAIRQKLRIDSLPELLEALKSDPALLKDSVDKLTINVTEFFRDRDYWQVFKDNVAQLAARTLPLRFWSAGCASGEEPYSLAYMLINMLPRSCWVIEASDVSNRALEAAREGIYAEKSFKNLTAEEVSLIFDAIGDDLYRVKNRLRQCVTYFRHNLLRDAYPQGMDVVLCRNVIIYFTDSAKRTVLSRIAKALKPGGLLFLGGSEQIITPADYGLDRVDVYIYKKL
ncbi:MAG TPA: protein-glutamate O-methyltransferase CheR [Bacillota bacterium]|nr:protein-glutamate O-methyltransferase CheR [Bacillota bacterium]HPZ22197.1 protein-glutamate O-methyltransferase CheR [Bacillota bacterium]HQD20109.1 protein-glutamate O-methyltransferase CheR [Bacillota bacterium]